jgi:hypothetical protein
MLGFKKPFLGCLGYSAILITHTIDYLLCLFVEVPGFFENKKARKKGGSIL